MQIAVKLYPVTRNLLDIFTGLGWEEWTRVHIRPGKGPVSIKDITLVGGTKLPNYLILQIVASYKGK